jgi:hypothetical protein
MNKIYPVLTSILLLSGTAAHAVVLSPTRADLILSERLESIRDIKSLDSVGLTLISQTTQRPPPPSFKPMDPVTTPQIDKSTAASGKPIAAPRKPIAAPRKPIAAPRKPIAAPRKDKPTTISVGSLAAPKGPLPSQQRFSVMPPKEEAPGAPSGLVRRSQRETVGPNVLAPLPPIAKEAPKSPRSPRQEAGISMAPPAYRALPPTPKVKK